MKGISSTQRALLLCSLCILTALLATSCTIRRGLGGGIEIVPGVGDDPSIGGYYNERTIDGRCYLSNGVWCVPCRGGQMVKCSDILRSGPPPDEGGLEIGLGDAAGPDGFDGDSSNSSSTDDGAADDDLESTLGDQFYQLTGGLDGETFAIVSGLAFWEAGDVVDLPLFVNYFDSDEDILDVSFIWRTDWAQPPADLPSGVELAVFIDGNFEDESPETMMFRITGPTAAVEEAVSGMGTDVLVTLANGWTYP